MSAPGDPACDAQQRADAHWGATLRATALLLAAWFVSTFVLGWFARDLQVHVFGWPFSFWMAAQGALLVYVGITWVYARHMRRLDERYGIADVEPGPTGPPDVV